MSQSRFDTAIELVLGEEGGLSNNPSDHGGLTNRGVTLDTYIDYLHREARWSGVGTRQRASALLRALSREEAIDIYLRLFWDPSAAGACELPLAVVVFDMAVNSGPSIARKYLQRALNLAGTSPRLTVDGAIGSTTKAALHALSGEGQRRAALRFLGLRQEFYDDIVARAPSQRTFAKGWHNRLQHLRSWTLGLSTWEKVTA